jgi:hypothetical protein
LDDTRENLHGSAAQESLLTPRRAAVARRAAASPTYWDWLLSKELGGDGHANGNGNGCANGNGHLNGHSNGNGHANGNGHVNGNGNGNGNGHSSVLRRAIEQKALQGMTPTGLARRLGR